MKISKVIERLEQVKKAEGDIEVTGTSSFLPDGYSRDDGPIADVFESTIENFVIVNDSSGLGRRVRLFL